MFPHRCGEQFEQAVAAGVDPKTVVPDEFVIVRGGTKPVPAAGEVFSCAAGPTLVAAGCALPNNQIRATLASAIRQAGGVVDWVPEFSRRGTMNKQHVHVMEVGPTVFGEPQPNPVAKADRIDAGK
jgi:hypothetical protein